MCWVSQQKRRRRPARRVGGETFEISAHLEYPLVIDLVEDGPVDLVGFQGHPVEDGHAELGFDGFLDLNGWTGQGGK